MQQVNTVINAADTLTTDRAAINNVHPAPGSEYGAHVEQDARQLSFDLTHGRQYRTTHTGKVLFYCPERREHHMTKKSTDAPAKIGRPTVMTDATVQKILDSLWNGSDIEKACKDAGIAKQTFYNHYHANQSFMDAIDHVMRATKLNASIIAHKALIKGMQDGDAHLALDYLKNTDPAFSTRTESKAAVEVGATLSVDDARAAFLAEFRDKCKG